MPDVTLAAQKIVRAGLVPTYTTPLLTTNNYKFKNDGKTFLHVKKTGAGACDCTFTTPRTVGSLAIADPVVQVPATTGDKMIGPFEPDLFNDGDGNVTVTFSEITGLSAAVIQSGI